MYFLAVENRVDFLGGLTGFPRLLGIGVREIEIQGLSTPLRSGRDDVLLWWVCRTIDDGLACRRMAE